ncbi:PrsW family glutamic-type intramembrane protease [Actinophytocola oryzae]|nr:PrsW family glutamic-type intramembrane protease [Actinophytocola oryzae]
MVRRWLWVVVLVVCGLLFGAVWWVLRETGNPNLVPALILLGSAVIPLTFVTFVAGQRVGFGVGAGTVGTVVLVGGVVGVVLAGLVEYDTVRGLGALPMVGVGLIEEAAKLTAPVAVLLVLVVLRRRRAPADGLLLGVAAGAGFAVLETMGYALVVLVESSGSLDALDDVLLMRGAMSPAAHMAWTGITAAALWAAAGRGWKGWSWLWFVGGFAVAVALHATWDSANSTWVYVVLGAVSLGILLTATILFHPRTGRARRPVQPTFAVGPA